MRISWNHVLLSFCAGLLLGAWVGIRHEKAVFRQFWSRGPETQKILARLSRKLDLNPQQEDQVRTLLESKREKVLILHQKMRAQFEALRLSMRSDIAQILNPEQKEKFVQMTQKWDKRHPKALSNSIEISSGTPLSSH